ncbi:hypothetical protein KB1_01690 [Cutibacterium modestum]|uniref:Uncharacterized protein n=1 Tax=Cutibacterium modestum TaxID=2559073 RepID=A0AAD1KN79_9ACTN|nr:hypothetical protein KB1_01690 [Cutibacterium modestum]
MPGPADRLSPSASYGAPLALIKNGKNANGSTATAGLRNYLRTAESGRIIHLRSRCVYFSETTEFAEEILDAEESEYRCQKS